MLRLSVNFNFYTNGVWGGAPSKVAGAAAPDYSAPSQGEGVWGWGFRFLSFLI